MPFFNHSIILKLWLDLTKPRGKLKKLLGKRLTGALLHFSFHCASSGHPAFLGWQILIIVISAIFMYSVANIKKNPCSVSKGT